MPPPTALNVVNFVNFLNFMWLFGNFWQNHRLAPHPGGLAPLPMGNPVSAPGVVLILANVVFLSWLSGHFGKIIG